MGRRVLALDVGDVRVGVAVTDEALLIAQPVTMFKRVGFGPDAREVLALCEKYDTDRVLLGLPLNMDGTEGEQARKVRLFGERLEMAGLRLRYQDERRTTVTAQQTLLEGGVRRDARRDKVDQIAAAIILRQWLDAGGVFEGDAP